MRAIPWVVLAAAALVPGATAHLDAWLETPSGDVAWPAIGPHPLPVVNPEGGPMHALNGQDLRWDGAEGGYSIRFECQEAENATQSAIACPLLVPDFEDIMGQPRLMVDPRDTHLVAFHALHGGRGLHPVPSDQPPSDTSRSDVLHQPHTVFQTTNGGSWWDDNRYYSPWKGATQSEYDQVYGEDNAATLDAQGRMHLASLYSFRDNGEPKFRYAVVLWKADRINHAFDPYDQLVILDADQVGNAMDSLHLVYVPGQDQVLALWRESRTDNVVQGAVPEGPRSWIGAAYSKAGQGGQWTPLNADQRVGPCRAISNAIVEDGLAYVACLPDEGYKVPGADAAFYQIHTIDVATGTTAHAGSTQIPSGNAVLSKHWGGRMAIAAAGTNGEGTPFLRVSVGEGGRDWSVPRDFGDRVSNVSNAAPGVRLVDARVQAVTSSLSSGYLHVLYQERYAREGVPTPDAGTPTLYKAIAAIDIPAINLIDAFPLNVGGAFGAQGTCEAFEPQYQGVGEAIFADLHDDFVVLKDHKGQPREFIAYGDYGCVRLAEMVEDQYTIPSLPLPGQPGPIPAPNAGVDPSTVGAVAGVIAGSMVLRLLASRKKSKVEAPTL